MTRSINEIRSGPLRGESAFDWAQELQWAVNETLAMVNTRDELLAENRRLRNELARLQATLVETNLGELFDWDKILKTLSKGQETQ